MGRGIFCWLVIDALLFVMPGPSFGANRAAEILARRLYEQAGHHVSVQDWKRGIRAYETAFFLDGRFHAAALQSKNLQEELGKRAERFYLSGLRAYQTLRFEEAKVEWRRGLHAVVDSKNSLKQKIETALALLASRGAVSQAGHGAVSGSEDVSRPALEEARQFLENGEPRRAALILKESLRRGDREGKIRNVLGRLERSLEEDETSHNLSATVQKQFGQARRLLEEAKGGGGYLKYREALSLFKKEDLKPPFHRELEAGLKESGGILLRDLEPKLKNWGRALQNEKAPLKEIGLALQKVLATHPPSPEARLLLQKVHALLEKRSEPVLMEARTVQELEGCRAALPLYAKAKEAALFSEIPAWQESHRLSETCAGILDSESDM